jgi:hypothetical protein
MWPVDSGMRTPDLALFFCAGVAKHFKNHIRPQTDFAARRMIVIITL